MIKKDTANKIFENPKNLIKKQSSLKGLQILRLSHNLNSTKIREQVSKIANHKKKPLSLNKNYSETQSSLSCLPSIKKHVRKNRIRLSKQSVNSMSKPNPICNISEKNVNFSLKLKEPEIVCITHTGSIDNKPKPYNQDRVLACKSVSNHLQYLVAVFDGHGPLGHLISGFLQINFTSTVKSFLNSCSTESLTKTFSKIINDLESKLMASNFDLTYSGSTLLSLFFSGQVLCCTNIGDSRAILISYCDEWSVRALNTEHKPYVKEEKNRVEKAGGRVLASIDGNGNAKGPIRVWGAKGGPGISVSRTLGDSYCKQFGVSSEPDIFLKNLTDNDRVVVLGTDGLWDGLSNEEVLKVVSEYWVDKRNAQSIAEALQKIAINKIKSSSSYQDDLSIVVIIRN